MELRTRRELLKVAHVRRQCTAPFDEPVGVAVAACLMQTGLEFGGARGFIGGPDRGIAPPQHIGGHVSFLSRESNSSSMTCLSARLSYPARIKTSNPW